MNKFIIKICILILSSISLNKINSQLIPFVSSDCHNCELNNLYNLNSNLNFDGMSMLQNPSLTINKVTYFNGVKDTTVFDTVINKNCIKVRTNVLFKGGQIKYKTPKVCQFAIGEQLIKNVYVLLPTPKVEYT